MIFPITKSRSKTKLLFFDTQFTEKDVLRGFALQSRAFQVYRVSGYVAFVLFSPQASLNLTNFYLLNSASSWKHIKVLEESKGD